MRSVFVGAVPQLVNVKTPGLARSCAGPVARPGIRWPLPGGRSQVAAPRWPLPGGRCQVAAPRWPLPGGRSQVAAPGGRAWWPVDLVTWAAPAGPVAVLPGAQLFAPR